MWTDIILWLVGLGVVSLLFGHFAALTFVTAANRALKTPATGPWDDVPAWLRKTTVGLVERTFFTIIIASGLSGTAIALVAWTALKGALYWSAFDTKFHANILIALLGSIVSLLFAVLGALICNGSLWGWYLRHAA